MSGPHPETDGWNHNSHYHDFILRLIPAVCDRALDVGCGVGTFARRVSPLAARVDAIDSDAAVVRRARELSAGFANIQFAEADFMTWPCDGPYDFISMIASLHHLPCAEALAKAARSLRTGGVLAVLGLSRPASLVHVTVDNLIGWPVSMYFRATRRRSYVGAVTSEPTMTLAHIEADALAILPGAMIRRHFLWRYSLTWTKP